MTDMIENITFPRTTYLVGNNFVNFAQCHKCVVELTGIKETKILKKQIPF